MLCSCAGLPGSGELVIVLAGPSPNGRALPGRYQHMRVRILLWTALSVLNSRVLAQSSQPQSAAQQPRYQANWPCTGKERSFDPSFSRAAEATGGHLVLLDRSEAGVSSTIATNDRQHKATIIRATGQSDSYVDVPFWVDSSVESLFVAGSMQCAQAIFLYDPQRSGIDGRIPGVEDTSFRAGRITVVRKPQAGAWELRLLGTGQYSVAVQAGSRVGLGTVDLRSNKLSVWLNESIADPIFRLVDAAGKPIRSVSLARDPDSPAHYSGPLDFPAVSFRIQVEGRGPNREAVWRTDPHLMDPPPHVSQKQ